jgi:phosphoribosyl-AMP cyclohydrolase / phosphoribosyl-ATP pyrophosphohydrolase
MLDLEKLNFVKGGGTVTVVTQDATTGAVLMVASADREALEKSVATGEMHYRSRTRGLWHKGATSGNTQRIVSLTADCDGDSVLARVIPKGPACHSGSVSCFGEAALEAEAFASLDAVIASRAAEQDGATSGASADKAPSYTQRLLGDRNLRLKKIGEEAAELVAACADGDGPRATEEASDLFYHVLVALRSLGVGFTDVRRTLAQRRKQ